MQGVTKDCESYALSAGIALGLAVLGKGGGAVGPTEVPLQSKLKYADKKNPANCMIF